MTGRVLHRSACLSAVRIGPQLFRDSHGTAPGPADPQLLGDSHGTVPGLAVPQLLGDSHGTTPGSECPQSPQAECCYLAGRCRQGGCGRRARGCRPAGRSRWRTRGSLQEKGQVRGPQAGVHPAVPLAESPTNLSSIPEGAAATVGPGSGLEPTPLPLCSPGTPEADVSYFFISFSPTPPEWGFLLLS